MTFYETLDSIMKQDFGGRGLLALCLLPHLRLCLLLSPMRKEPFF